MATSAKPECQMQPRREGILVNRDDIIRLANESGMVAKPCANENYIAVRAGEAEDTNERMRLTEYGQLLVVDEGYYWQVGTVEDVANAIRARGESK